MKRARRIILAAALVGAVLVLIVWLVGELREKVRQRPARARQAEAARLLGKPKEFVNSIGMTMVLIPAGEFQMGSKLSAKELVARYGGEERFYAAAKPVHVVRITKPFYMAATEVTQGQWRGVMGTNPSKFKGGESPPVERVSVNEALEFCARVSAMAKETYRLPTEAEWEYACRAGATTEFCYGDDKWRLGRYAWYWGNTKPEVQVFGITIATRPRDCRPHPVAQKNPNAWGLYDMHGNVSEWCQDMWHWSYDGAPTDGSAWLADGWQARHVPRGGSQIGEHGSVRCAYRWVSMLYRNPHIGFRVVMSPLALGSE